LISLKKERRLERLSIKKKKKKKQLGISRQKKLDKAKQENNHKELIDERALV
jgi:hypothetical protein